MTGPLSDGQRAETAPLARDNSRVEQNQHSAASSPGPDPGSSASGQQDRTRPAFVPPRPSNASETRSTARYPSNPPQGQQQQGQQQQGQQQQGQQQGYAPTGQQPIVPRAAPPTAATAVPGQRGSGRRVSPLGWTVRGAGLVAISVISGLLWLALDPGSGSSNGAGGAAPPTKNDFSRVMTIDGDQACADVSQGKIKKYFSKHPCQHLTRALYTTTLPDGRKVLTSIITVLMPDPASAAQLNTVATTNNTGNIKDLVDESSPGTEHYPKLDDDGYYSVPQEQLVAIGDSAYFGESTRTKDPALVDVTRDALQLAWPQDKTG